MKLNLYFFALRGDQDTPSRLCLPGVKATVQVALCDCTAFMAADRSSSNILTDADGTLGVTAWAPEHHSAVDDSVRFGFHVKLPCTAGRCQRK